MAITFGPFSLDVERHQLLRDGREIHVSLKAFDLLALLLRERPRLVTKSELHARLWPDTFVSDATLASVVAEVREALGEAAHDSRWIRTVHRLGYAFAGEAAETTPVTTFVEESGPCWLSSGDRRYELREGENLLGRGAQARVCIDCLSVSRRHARIVINGHEATIDDLGSRNGTFVDGSRVQGPTALRDGDPIRIGSVVLTFRTLADPASTMSLS